MISIIDSDDPFPDGEEDPVRFCRDCKHYKSANPFLFWGLEQHRRARCTAPHQISGNGLIHPALDTGSFCSLVRADKLKCGPDAIWFEPRND